MCQLSFGLTFFYIYQCLSSGSATSHDLLFSWSWSSAKKDLLLLAPPACQWLVGMSECWWRAGVRLSARNQSQARVLGLWPTNCTHPAIALLEKPTRADRSSRGLFSLCHRPGAVVRFNPGTVELCRTAMTDRWWKPLKAVSSVHQERSWCAGAGAGGVLRRRIPRIPDMGQLPPPDLDGRWSKPDAVPIFLLYKPILITWLNLYFKHSIWMYVSFLYLADETLNSMFWTQFCFSMTLYEQFIPDEKPDHLVAHFGQFLLFVNVLTYQQWRH